ncbi:MAG: UDP-N-acetylglucosamine 2-epimerase (non-hydrolyzing) [Ruminococcaceae bacterium]|nr:UDP-N-acetylglucosamine 2-epimerase (non-hydrolyzing) [Oscillospiraceae bacterium]
MENTKKIIAVIGTRPDGIKMCPLIKELKSRGEFKVTVCATGQHRDLLDDILETFEITPDYDLGIMREGQDLFDITTEVMLGMRNIFLAEKPDGVLVHGDTTSAFASALAAFYLKIPVFHVEAGLRTYDIYSPYPEEFNRRAIGVLAQKHFAPTERAESNLLSEGIDRNDISVTGNTVIDALRTTVSGEYSRPALRPARGERVILLTAHRRENCGEAMRGIFAAVRRVAEERDGVKIIYPMHPNPAIRKVAENMLGGCGNICLCEPLGVGDFHKILSACYLVLTDSGGVQEEAAALGKPVLVLRNTTERAEGIQSGGIRLAGTSSVSVYRGITRLLDDRALYYAMSVAKNPYGDGRASEKIVDILEQFCS